MARSTQFRAQKAIDDVLDGRSIRGASKLYQIERTYLRRRILGVRIRKKYNESLQKLSKHQKNALSR